MPGARFPPSSPGIDDEPMNSAAMTIVRRPFTAECWREVLYLIAGFATATAAFVFVTVGLSLTSRSRSW